MRKIVWICALGCLSALGLADIKVTVNGDPVLFNGVGPQKVAGRVLVPLRGVMEKLGAFVGWDAPTRTVHAQKGNIDLSMQLGARTATVNGRTVNLDVPAQQISGTTMVPLRFMGEALGAEVTFDAATETINIVVGQGGSGGGGATTGDTGTTGTTGSTGTGGGTGPTTITSFTHDGNGWIHPGQTVNFVLNGSPKAHAEVNISGLTTPVVLTESQAGKYTGSWVAPQTPIVLQATSVIGVLKLGQDVRMIQSGQTLSVDTDIPVIKGLAPDAGASVTVAQPDISGIFEDTGSGVDRTSVKIKVNGKDVTAGATVSEYLFLYRPAQPLPNGLCSVEVSMRDKAGNSKSATYTFTISAANNASIRTFIHTAREFAQVGKPITFRIDGESGAKITLSAGNVFKDIALREGPKGAYGGQYLVKPGDVFNNTVVKAKVVLASGLTFEVESPYKIPKTVGEAVAFGPATIVSHKEGDRAVDPLVLTGKATPKTRVQIHVTYATTMLNALRVTGALADQTVDVDANGAWKSDPISLSFSMKGSNTEYTVTVTAVNTDGKQATPVTVKLKG